MKNAFLLILLLASLSSLGQTDCKSMKECNNDTLKYMRTNYIGNAKRYLNKSMKQLLDETEFHIGVFMPGWTLEPREKAQIYTVMFYFQASNKVWYVLDIVFNKPYKWIGRDKYLAHSNPDEGYAAWDDFYYNVFKDYTIKSMRVYRSPIQFVDVGE